MMFLCWFTMAIAPPEDLPEQPRTEQTRPEPVMPDGYVLRRGNGLERSRLLKIMHRTYQELYPSQNFDHLAQTVEAYFSKETPLWWVDQATGPTTDKTPGQIADLLPQAAIGCLWMGTAVDQVRGDRHSHIFLLYIAPAHRRRGLGRQLMQVAEAWAQGRGDRQISLQVFSHNAPALALYQSLGYQPQSVALFKSLPASER
jgi:ribosomal protein S18 acetylase RimI-like enzyme